MNGSLHHPWRAALLVLGAIGLNLVPITLPGDVHFILGPFVYMPLVLVLPAPWSVLAAASAMVVTIQTLGHPFAFVLAVLEAAWLALAQRRWPRGTIWLDFVFWVFASATLSPWFYRVIGRQPDDVVWIVIGKQVFNQLGAVGLCVFLLRYTQLARWLADRPVPPRRTRDMIFHSVFMLALVPLALVGIGVSMLLREYTEREDREVLGETSFRLTQQLDLFLAGHKAAVATLAHSLNRGAGDSAALLQATHEAHPAFVTMLIADRNGLILQAAPRGVLERSPRQSVADRDYFTEVRRENRMQVSGVFRGRGFGQDILVAISAPLRDADGNFAGIVEASLEVRRFAKSVVGHRVDGPLEIIFADSRGRVIYADPATGVPSLARLEYQPQGSLLKATAAGTGMHFDRPATGGGRERLAAFHYRSPETGMVVITQWPFLSTLKGSGWVYLLFAGVSAGILAAAALIARSARRKTTTPLEHFAHSASKQAVQGHVAPIPNSFAEAPYEVAMVFSAFNELATQVNESHATLLRHNEALDRRVAERTHEANEARRLAEAASRSKSEFLAMTGHEIRTPLNAIVGLAESISERCTDTALVERLEIISRAGRRLVGVVNDLLDLSRIEAGKLALRPTAIEVRGLCHEVERLLAIQAQKHGLEFTVEIEPPAPVWVELDGERLQQVLINLVGNAIKFTRRGGVRLCVEFTRLEAQRVGFRFAVLDTGPGIPPDLQAKLFQPFVQLPGAASAPEPGSGLGLAISRRLVALFGDTLSLHSRVGVGSVFYFSLTAPEVPAPVAAPPPSPSLSSISCLRILAADDNLANQEVLRSMLEGHCACIDLVDAAGAALDAFAEKTYDVALIDLEMPDADGYSVARRVREGSLPLAQSCRLVAVSAHEREEVWQECAAAGFDDFVAKPVSRKVLLQALGGIAPALATA